MEGIRNFLGNVGLYHRVIKDISKIAHPLFMLLENKVKFIPKDVCQKAFECLKKKLILVPIIMSPNWPMPFELM